ncbi:MAG: hypothetical protein LBU61_06405 [Coriobacteriales bacterium]|jgi:hypothetical protein|nr:hypothetical protein [Coriobacteriales bacterium]
MPTLTPLENYKRTLKGEIPEYVPSMMDGGILFSVPLSMDNDLGLMIGGWPEGEVRYDIFGVPYVTERNAGGGALPMPGKFILDDITKWRDVIKRPEVIDQVDWEYCAAKDLPTIDPNTMFFQGGPAIGNGYFEMLCSFMGFDNGLIACLEEPEEVKDLMNFLCDMNVEITKKFLYHYKPEGWFMADDIAHDRAPFVSLQVFLDIFEPVWRRSTAPAAEAGLHASHHNCGKLDEFIPYIVDMGFDSWNPAEPQNDLVAIKQKFPGKLTISGGFAGNGYVCWPDTTEEEVRAYVRQQLDLLAPGGSYVFGGFIMGPAGDPEAEKRMGWINDEFEKLRYSYY